MNKKIFCCLFLLAISSVAFSQSEDSLGLPGDNLDLYGVLKLFEDAKSMEEFEQAINTESNGVNNLDLNEDGDVDYIRVVDNIESEAHAIALEVSVSDSESQNVAVIALEKTANEEAHIQLIGDEDLYGVNYIVEPQDSKKGSGRSPVIGIIVNVWAWHCVRFVYAPAYVVWVSPWHWHHWPGYWHPWRHAHWHTWHPHVMHYHAHYHRTTVVHVTHAQSVYHKHRTRSAVVRHKSPGGVNKARNNSNSHRDDAVKNRGGKGKTPATAKSNQRGNTQKSATSKGAKRSGGRGKG